MNLLRTSLHNSVVDHDLVVLADYQDGNGGMSDSSDTWDPLWDMSPSSISSEGSTHKTTQILMLCTKRQSQATFGPKELGALGLAPPGRQWTVEPSTLAYQPFFSFLYTLEETPATPLAHAESFEIPEAADPDTPPWG